MKRNFRYAVFRISLFCTSAVGHLNCFTLENTPYLRELVPWEYTVTRASPILLTRSGTLSKLRQSVCAQLAQFITPPYPLSTNCARFHRRPLSQLKFRHLSRHTSSTRSCTVHVRPAKTFNQEIQDLILRTPLPREARISPRIYSNLPREIVLRI